MATINASNYKIYKNNSKKDSTAGFQAALKAAKGGTLNIPKGTYYIKKTLVIYSNTVINGNDCTFQRLSRFNASFMATRVSGDMETGGYNGHHDITVNNIIFDSKNAKAKGNMFSTVHSKNITVKNCKFYTCYGYHAIEFNSSDNCKAINCTFRGHKKIASSDGKESIQIDVAYPGSSVGKTDGTMAKNITVSGCTFSPDSRGNPAAEVAVGSHSAASGKYYTGIVITNNTFNSNPRYSIRALNWSGAIIENNTFAPSSSALSHIKLRNSKSTTIKNNTFNSTPTGIHIVASSSSTTITSNKFHKNKYAVHCAQVSTITATLNYFDNSPSYFYSTSKPTFKNNLLFNSAFKVDGTDTSHILAPNIVLGYKTTLLPPEWVEVGRNICFRPQTTFSEKVAGFESETLYDPKAGFDPTEVVKESESPTGAGYVVKAARSESAEVTGGYGIFAGTIFSEISDSSLIRSARVLVKFSFAVSLKLSILVYDADKKYLRQYIGLPKAVPPDKWTELYSSFTLTGDEKYFTLLVALSGTNLLPADGVAYIDAADAYTGERQENRPWFSGDHAPDGMRSEWLGEPNNSVSALYELQ